MAAEIGQPGGVWAGRKPKRQVCQGGHEGLEEAIAVRLPAVADALIEAALVGAGTRVIAKRRAVGTIVVVVPQRDANGDLVLGANGLVVTHRVPLFPDRDPGEMILIQSTIVEPWSVAAMRFMAAQVAGRR